MEIQVEFHFFFWSRFTKRVMRADESIDNYAADLKHLLSASGQVEDDSSPVLIEQFISGLPRDFAQELRINGTRSTVSDCVECVRRLRSAERSSGRAVTACGGGTGGYGSSRHRQQSGSRRPGKQVLCFNCQTVGHYARDCPQPRKAVPHDHDLYNAISVTVWGISFRSVRPLGSLREIRLARLPL